MILYRRSSLFKIWDLTRIEMCGIMLYMIGSV